LRLLAVCKQMGLVDWDNTKVRSGDSIARLTEEGLQASQGGDIFVPERGTWSVWVVQDPLIPEVERLLRVEPFREPTAFDEVGRKDRPREERRTTIDLPEWVQEACSVSGKLGWGDGRAISMLDIEAQGEPVDAVETRITLILRVAPGEAPTVRLKGEIEGQRADYELEHAPAPGFDEVWRYCLGGSAARWDGSRLAVQYDTLDESERANFESHIRFESWSHPTHGTFGPFHVPHVPLRPATDLDASLWANWLLVHRTQAYVRKADFIRRREEVQQTFVGYRLQLMSQEQLAASLRKTSGARPDRKYWHLQASLDWAL
jgi:hypothetical protein